LAETGSDGGIIVAGHQRSSVPGLHAAGDVVLGLDQISHAVGEGGVAATTIRNDLALIQPLVRCYQPGGDPGAANHCRADSDRDRHGTRYWVVARSRRVRAWRHLLDRSIAI
jgi:hypothetical protein